MKPTFQGYLDYCKEKDPKRFATPTQRRKMKKEAARVWRRMRKR